MANRIDLHNKLKSLLGGSSNVYFQPPESLLLKYPCIVYKLATPDVKFANDEVYNHIRSYSVTYITRDPDDDKIDEMFALFKNKVRYDRSFTSDNLNHYVFTVYN